MNINRHNYEEYFLLYVDNELAAGEQKVVEDFVELHADLAAELKMLQQSVIALEHVKFAHKNELLKHEQGVCSSNYEEHFLLAIDNELNLAENAELEQFILKHPVLQPEYTVLSQCKLQPDVLEYPFKKELYRSEASLILNSIFWARTIAAAAIIGVVIVGGYLYTISDHFNNADTSVAIAKTAKSVIKPQAAAPIPPAIPEAKSFNHTQQVVKIAQKQPNKIATAEQKPLHPAQSVPELTALAITEKQVEKKPVEVNDVQQTPVVQTNNPVTFASTNEGELPVQIIHTIYSDNYSEEGSNINVGFTRINKNKLKGIFKKAAALLDKKISFKDDDQSTQIASFQLKG